MKIWRAHAANLGAAEWRALARLLDAAEQAQAVCMRFVVDRRAFVLAHGLRRLALAHLIGLPARGARDLRFSHNAAGRPFLIGEHPSRWFFSHAHAREGVLFAASRQHPVGVDVESLEPGGGPADSALLRRYMDWPAGCGLDWDGPGGFADGWTALESFTKALGCGLAGLQHSPPVHCTALAWRHAGRNPLRLALHQQQQQQQQHQQHHRPLTALSARLQRRQQRPTAQEALVLRPRAPAGCAAAVAVRQGAQAPPPRLDECRLEDDLALLHRLC